MLRRSVASLLLPMLVVTPLEAQGLRSQISKLFSFGDCGQPLCLAGSISVGGLSPHGFHFIPSAAAGNATLIGFVTDAIGSSVANTPISATSSGATFSFEGGLPVKTSVSSGPVFGERSQTLGRGRVFIGANVTGIHFESLRGVPLDNIALNFTHQDVGNPGLGDRAVENDVIAVRLSLDVNLVVASFFVTYGLLDFVDIGVAVPVVRTSLEGTSVAQILPFGGDTAVHFFAGTPSTPVLRATAATRGSASGFGDVAVRVKVNFVQGKRAGVSMLIDGRLPTGDSANLTGAGDAAVRALAIVSARFGDFSPHLNAGYLGRGGAQQNDAVLATVGLDQPLGSWATLAADLISEWQVGVSKLTLPGPVNYILPFPRTIDPTNVPNRRDNLLNGSFGFKFITPRGVTVVANSIVPLGHGGLTPGVVWTMGLEYSF